MPSGDALSMHSTNQNEGGQRLSLPTRERCAFHIHSHVCANGVRMRCNARAESIPALMSGGGVALVVFGPRCPARRPAALPRTNARGGLGRCVCQKRRAPFARKSPFQAKFGRTRVW